MKTSERAGEDVWTPSVCGMCPDQCGILVRRVDGVVTRIEGNPESPLGRGRLCARGLAGVQLLYDPHRLNQPLKRGNPQKGVGVDPCWQVVSWEEALGAIVARMKQVRTDDPTRLLLCGTAVSPEPLAFARRVFLPAFGSANAIACDGPPAGGYPDPESCEYVLTFGADCVSGAMAERMADARVRGMRTLAVEPFLSPAAEKADEWLPVRPGSEGALACAILNLLLNEYGLFDAEYVRRRTDGPYLVRPDGSYARDAAGKPLVWDMAAGRVAPFDEEGADVALEGTHIVEGQDCRPVFDLLREAVHRWTPEAAAEATTIAVDTIRRIAREFGETARIGSVVSIDGHELPLRPVAAVGRHDGSSAARAVALLNEVVGAVDVPGGLLSRATVSSGHPQTGPPRCAPAIDSDGIAHESEDAGRHIALAECRPEVLIDCGSNLLMNVASPERCLEALKECFVVSFGLYSDETAEALADIVLPDACYLERLGLPFCASLPGRGDWACQVRQPAIPPLFERRHSSEVLLEIGERLGIADAMNAAVNDLYGLRPPHALEPGERCPWEETVEHICRGWFGSEHGLDWFRRNGVLAGPKRLEEAYPTAFQRGRSALHPERLARLEEAQTDPQVGFDLEAVSYRAPWQTASHTRENPWLEEVSEAEPYSDFVCLNPRTAAIRGIADGDPVWVESTSGHRIRGLARLTEGVHPEAAAIAGGGGHWARGMPVARGRGAFFNALLTSEGKARVRVYKE
jgi:molybdopterin-containing oxidoreductase family molybdopterin binding subunit